MRCLWRHAFVTNPLGLRNHSPVAASPVPSPTKLTGDPSSPVGVCPWTAVWFCFWGVRVIVVSPVAAPRSLAVRLAWPNRIQGLPKRPWHRWTVAFPLSRMTSKLAFASSRSSTEGCNSLDAATFHFNQGRAICLKCRSSGSTTSLEIKRGLLNTHTHTHTHTRASAQPPPPHGHTHTHPPTHNKYNDPNSDATMDA